MSKPTACPKKPKIVFFDIDDTLYIKHQERVPQSAIEALKQLKQQGIMVAIATGRGRAVFPKAVYELIETVGIDVLVTINGQCSHHQGELLAHYPMTPAQIKLITDYVESNNLSYAYMTDTEIIALAEDDALAEALNSLKIAYRTARHDDIDLSIPIYQVVAFHPDNTQVNFEFPSTLKIMRWHKNGIDILDATGSKARGIAQALNKLGLDFEDAMAFGDGVNDIEMLQTVGFGVAMGNAHPDVKAAADYVCPAAWEDGIYQGLQNLGLLPHG